MTWFADLSPCNYFAKHYLGKDIEKETDGLIAVGWLGERHPYPQGKVLPEFSGKLNDLLVEAWQPMLFRGFHICELCESEAPASALPSFDAEEMKRRVMEAIEKAHFWNLFIPSKAGLFASPSMIGHYISAHRYQPPDFFYAAVMECPPWVRRRTLKRSKLAPPLDSFQSTGRISREWQNTSKRWKPAIHRAKQIRKRKASISLCGKSMF